MIISPGEYKIVVSSKDEQVEGRLVIDDPTPPTPNKPPTAVIKSSVSSGVSPLLVEFSAVGSTDPDGTIAKYAWAFGDGDTIEGRDVQHKYTTPGLYTTVLIVTDDKGETGTASVEISVMPPVTIKVAYTTLDATGTIPPTYPWAIGDPGGPTGSAIALELAVPFVAVAEGQLLAVQLPFVRRNIAPVGTTPRMFSLAADANGKPGNALESWNLVPSLTLSMVDLASLNRPVLQNGVKYWFTAHIVPNGVGSDYWYGNAFNLNGPMLWRRSLTNSLSQFTSSLPAFRLLVESQ